MIDTQYEDLLSKVLDEGEEKPDRTGTGTYSLFGAQLRYDLSKGFPLITTKKIHFPSVVGELAWFLSGSTDVSVLRDEHGVSIWDEWEQEDGTIGPMYGHQWVNWGGETSTQRPPKLPAGVDATYLGVANGRGKEGHPLKKTWEGMIARCYDPRNIGYAKYGGRGVSVCDSWLLFENFALDAEYLPGYSRKLADPDTRYVLDKDTRGTGLLYSLETCVWVTDRENSLAKSNTLYTLEDSEGRLHSFTNPTEFCKKVGIPNNNLSDLWTGRKNAKVRHGYRLVSTQDISGKGIDQIANVIESIKTDPHSRRHIVSAWNVDELHLMALAPCHVLFQFYVSADGKRLSCHLFQRSADVFLGLPFNIASYALLTQIIAEQTGLEVGELLWSGTDVHLYKNHEHQAEEQLSREVRPFPRVGIKGGTPIDSWDANDVRLYDYNPWPAIKAPVAV